MKTIIMKCLCLLVVSLSFVAQSKEMGKISSYSDNYFLGTYTSDINKDVYSASGFEGADELNHFEVKYQFSLAIPLIAFDGSTALMASYTQMSLWQLANSSISSPFRETNYTPQIFLMSQGSYPIFNSLEVGFKHQSNGRTGDLSRSWDRLYFAIENLGNVIEYGFQYWYVMGDTSENRDIEEYIAPYEIWLKTYNSLGEFNARFSQHLDNSRAGIEVGYTMYLNEYVGFYGQVWHGYGETLIDYNNNQTRVGLGLKLVNW